MRAEEFSVAGVAQLVERHVANVVVAGSSPVSRSSFPREDVHVPLLCAIGMSSIKGVRREYC